MINERFENYDDVRREFDRLSFAMPGWTVELLAPNWDGSPWSMDLGMLRITTDVLDSRGSGETIAVGRAAVVPGGMPAESFPRWVFHQIRDFLDHEAKEWFRQDGVLLYDPHKEG